jgi:hypothetical protein
MLNCFQLYFQPVYLYVKRVFCLATDNNYNLTITSTTFAGVSQILEHFFAIDLFGIPNALLLLVMMTILVDAYYGVRKSIKQSKEALVHAQFYEVGSPDYKRQMRIHQLRKFNPTKLQFTFFKSLTLLGYLYFAKTLLTSDADNALGQILGFTSGLILKAPVAIFWYYDFKSIGENATYLYGKKAPIFTIVESIFELRIKKFKNKE